MLVCDNASIICNHVINLLLRKFTLCHEFIVTCFDKVIKCCPSKLNYFIISNSKSCIKNILTNVYTITIFYKNYRFIY